MDVRRPFGALLVAPLLLLTACGGTDSAAGDPTPKFSPSPIESSSAPPKRESPEHFIRRWLKAEQSMESSGDPTAYLRMASECKECRSLARQVRQIYKAGGFIRWAGSEVHSIKPYGSNGGQAFEISLTSAPTTYKEAEGGPTEHLAGGTLNDVIRLKESGESWTVVARSELAS